MKQYKVKILTPTGTIERIIFENEVNELENELKTKYGTFVMLSSEPFTDLFESPEKLPKEVSKIINKAGDIETYEDCKSLLNALKPHKYTFDYYLDAVPYNLRKM